MLRIIALVHIEHLTFVVPPVLYLMYFMFQLEVTTIFLFPSLWFPTLNMALDRKTSEVHKPFHLFPQTYTE